MQLYKASNINFDFNGDFNLDNIISNHTFTGGINKIWGIEVEIQFDEEEKWRNISQYDILKCDTPMLKDQFFRIFDVNADDGNLVINARLLFYDLSKTLILDSRNVNANGQEAISKAFQGTKFTGHSNITTRSNCNWIKKNIVNALMGNEDYSFVSNYKGELWIDNFDITLQDSIGGDYGVQCTYGKDIDSIEKIIDIDTVFTRLVPYGNNNLMLDEIYVDSPLINNYPIIQEKEISFADVKIKEKPEDEEGFNTKAEAQAELRKRCQDLFANGLDKPLANFKVSIIALENTEEYKDFKDLVNIGLGDTVRIYYKPLGIDLNVRCLNIKAEYIFAKKVWEYTEIELGNYINDFNDIVSDISNKATNANNKINNITDGDSIIAEKVKGFLDATKTSLKASKQIGEKQEYRIALSEDLDPNSPTYGAMLWGSGKIFLADKRTLDGKDWDYSTAITPKGVMAETLIGKLLASIDGANYFDLETGIIKGKDLKIDLTNGSLNFKNGLIEGEKSSWNLDTGVFQSIQSNGDKIIISPTEGFYRQIGSNKNEYFSLSRLFEIDEIITPTKVGISTYTFSKTYEFDLPIEFIGKATTVNTNLENSYASVLVIKGHENTYGWIEGNKLKVKYDLKDTTIGSKTIDGISCLTETPFAHTIDIKININIVA